MSFLEHQEWTDFWCSFANENVFFAKELGVLLQKRAFFCSLILQCSFARENPKISIRMWHVIYSLCVFFCSLLLQEIICTTQYWLYIDPHIFVLIYRYAWIFLLYVSVRMYFCERGKHGTFVFCSLCALLQSSSAGNLLQKRILDMHRYECICFYVLIRMFFYIYIDRPVFCSLCLLFQEIFCRREYWLYIDTLFVFIYRYACFFV